MARTTWAEYSREGKEPPPDEFDLDVQVGQSFDSAPHVPQLTDSCEKGCIPPETSDTCDTNCGAGTCVDTCFGGTCQGTCPENTCGCPTAGGDPCEPGGTATCDTCSTCAGQATCDETCATCRPCEVGTADTCETCPTCETCETCLPCGPETGQTCFDATACVPEQCLIPG
jgi:hypothetical protein